MNLTPIQIWDLLWDLTGIVVICITLSYIQIMLIIVVIKWLMFFNHCGNKLYFQSSIILVWVVLRFVLPGQRWIQTLQDGVHLLVGLIYYRPSQGLNMSSYCHSPKCRTKVGKKSNLNNLNNFVGDRKTHSQKKIKLSDPIHINI